MSQIITISTVGHFIYSISFIGVAVYAFLRQKGFQRTTQNAHLLFYVIIGLSILFAFLNIYRLVYEISENRESNISLDLDSIAQYSGILIQSALILSLFASKIMVKPNFRRACILAISAMPFCRKARYISGYHS
jgi:hypothetical protein